MRQFKFDVCQECKVSDGKLGGLGISLPYGRFHPCRDYPIRPSFALDTRGFQVTVRNLYTWPIIFINYLSYYAVN